MLTLLLVLFIPSLGYGCLASDFGDWLDGTIEGSFDKSEEMGGPPIRRPSSPDNSGTGSTQAAMTSKSPEGPLTSIITAPAMPTSTSSALVNTMKGLGAITTPTEATTQTSASGSPSVNSQGTISISSIPSSSPSATKTPQNITPATSSGTDALFIPNSSTSGSNNGSSGSAAPSDLPGSSSGRSNGSSKSNTSAIIGGVIGGLVFIIAVGFIIYCRRKRARRRLAIIFPYHAESSALATQPGALSQQEEQNLTRNEKQDPQDSVENLPNQQSQEGFPIHQRVPRVLYHDDSGWRPSPPRVAPYSDGGTRSLLEMPPRYETAV